MCVILHELWADQHGKVITKLEITDTATNEVVYSNEDKDGIKALCQ